MFKERRHLAIFSPDLLTKVLQGEKKVDVRLSERAIPPYQAIHRNDRILIKKSGGKVFGEAKVSNVLFYDRLNPAKVKKIKRKYNKEIRADESFWQKKRKAKYATVIFLNSVKRYLGPINFTKHDRRAWVVLGKK